MDLKLLNEPIYVITTPKLQPKLLKDISDLQKYLSEGLVIVENVQNATLVASD